MPNSKSFQQIILKISHTQIKISDGSTTLQAFFAQYIYKRELFYIFLKKTMLLTISGFTPEKKGIIMANKRYYRVWHQW